MTTEDELERKLQELFDSTILGGYNYEARKQAMEAKFHEQVKLYRNKAKIDDRKRQESNIRDTKRRALYQTECKVEDLQEDVNDFESAHFNLKYRQLKGKCPDLQVELDKLRFDQVTEAEQVRKKKELLKKIESIETILVNKVQNAAGVGHDSKTCRECQ